MNNLRFILSCCSLLLGCQPAFSAVNSYQCVISEQLSINDDGTLTRPRRAYLIDQRFAVDRNTGQLVGPEGDLWQLADHKITVLARGNAENSFTMISIGPAAQNGVHATMLMIDEFTKGKSKPFRVLSGGQVISGVCE